MLSPDVEIADIDGRHWDNWLRLLLPPGTQGDPRFALVWIDGDHIVKAVVRGHGAVPPGDVPFGGTSDEALRQLAEALGVGAVVVFEKDALPVLAREIERELRFEDDYVAQGLTALRALKKMAGRGIWTEPKVLELVPVPPFDALQKTFDFLVADGTSMIAYVIEDDRSGVHASIIATKVKGHVDQVATHEAIADLVPASALARDWRSRHRDVLAAVEERFAKPSVSVFLERRIYYRILTGPTDTLGRELRARNLVINPAPGWLLGLLGGATAWSMASRGATALSALLPDQAKQLAGQLARQARAAASSNLPSPWAMLGFDPVEAWLRLRHLYRG